MEPLKLISINIEGDKHWDRVLPFIVIETPDVICIQEIFKNDLGRIESLGYTSTFLPMTLKAEDGHMSEFGISIFSKLEFLESEQFYYHSPASGIQEFKREDKNKTMSHGVALATLRSPKGDFIIATTHFTWTPDGLSDTYQETHLETLFSMLRDKESHILCGDFNIPRGYNELYEKLTACYKDEIPETYATSLDLDLHRVKSDPAEADRVRMYMVDYIFSKPEYCVEDVRLQFGVSDHAAIVASIERR